MTMATAANDAAGPAVPLVGKKYMAKLGAMVNESAAGAMSAFARRHMEKMGWSEGKGLGKEEQGMATYVRVKKREEAMGIGVETLKVEEQQNQWWYNAYDKLADKIKIAMDSDDDSSSKSKKKNKKDSKKKSKKGKKRSRDSDASSSDEGAANKKFRVPTDEELFAATGGKLFGRRAYGSCNGKLKRDELLQKGKLKVVDPSAASASASSAEEQDDDEKKKKSKKSKKEKKSKKDKKSKKQKSEATDDDEEH